MSESNSPIATKQRSFTKDSNTPRMIAPEKEKTKAKQSKNRKQNKKNTTL